MCAVSMVYAYGRDRIDENQWTRESWDHYQKLIKQAEAFDKAAKQPDCEDIEKAKWMKNMEERIKKLEDKGYNSDW